MRSQNLVLAAAFAFAGYVFPTAAHAGASGDAQILASLHNGNQAEVEEGGFIVTQDVADGVKEFAQTLVTDHGAADVKVLAVAGTASIDINSVIAASADEQAAVAAHQAFMAQLQGLQGDELAKAFLQGELADHNAEIAKLEAAEPLLVNPAVKSLVDELLPKFTAHRDLAQQLLTQFGT
jgi:putative membrane protein